MLRSVILRPSLPAILFFWLFLQGLTGQSQALCSIPQALHGTWRRIDNGNTITMTASETSGQEIKYSGTKDYTGGFECLESSGNQYVFRTKATVPNPGGSQSRGYFCWEMVRVSDVSYLLYHLTNKSVSGAFNTQPVYETLDSQADPALTTVCSLSAASMAPTLLYKLSGSKLEPITLAEQECSKDLLATFSYVKDSTGCQGSESQLDFCQGGMTARVNFTLCSVKILFSQEGLLSCIGSVTAGSTMYQMLYNHDDSVDNSIYYKFVCMQVTKSGDDQQATVYPNHCAATGGTSQQLTLKRTEGCSTVAAADSELDITVIVVSVVVGIVVIVVIIVAVVLFYKLVYLKRKRAVTPVKPVRNGKPLHANPEAPPNVTGDDTPSTQGEPRGSHLPPLVTNTPRTEPLRQ